MDKNPPLERTKRPYKRTTVTVIPASASHSPVTPCPSSASSQIPLRVLKRTKFEKMNDVLKAYSFRNLGEFLAVLRRIRRDVERYGEFAQRVSSPDADAESGSELSWPDSAPPSPHSRPSSRHSTDSSTSTASRAAADSVEQWDEVDHSDEILVSGSDLAVTADPETGRLCDEWYEPPEFEELLERLCGREEEVVEESGDEELASDEPESESEGDEPGSEGVGGKPDSAPVRPASDVLFDKELSTTELSGRHAAVAVSQPSQLFSSSICSELALR
ncbi:hypothetical protein K438DRAFT_1772389 [Mycena galopus ATCC 62051]|nr:hypothetical protein K438DRAFT_1772389 [Mycena galopus ATCC 62051]